MINHDEKKKFENIIQLYGRSIYRVCFRILKNHDDAEDAAQETFMRILGCIDLLDGMSTAAAGAYVMRIARSVSVNLIKSSGIYRLYSNDEMFRSLELICAKKEYEEKSAADNCTDRVIEIELKLSRSEFQFLSYHAGGGHTYRETSAYFGIRQECCRKRMQRIREKVRKSMHA